MRRRWVVGGGLLLLVLLSAAFVGGQWLNAQANIVNQHLWVWGDRRGDRLTARFILFES